MAFHVGQKVAVRYPHKKWHHVSGPHRGGEIPQAGMVYTIAGFYDLTFPCIFLLEIPGERAWDARDFRPVRTTSISIFTAMLRKAPAKEPA